MDNSNTEAVSKGLDSETAANLRKLMEYVSIIKENGELDIFTQLFQTDFRILTYLQKHPGTHPSIMADALKVTRPNIAANLRLLEQRKLIIRTIDENNRRQVYVELTEEGIEYLNVCEKQLGILFTGWFKILGEEEVSHLFKILALSSDPKIMTSNLKTFSFGE